MPSGLKGALLGFGNPLLDISAVVPKEMLDKYGLQLGNAIMAEDKHMALYQELVDKFPVEYIAGGATQNALRVAQWMLQCPGAASYVGAVGKDEFASLQEKVASKDGLRTCYLQVDGSPTGKCAVLVVDGERSLVASLGAAEQYKPEHVESNWAVVEAARVYYISSFFMTHSHGVIMRVAKHSAEQQKRFCMNLAAPFIMQVPPFKAALMETMPYIDLLVGNESEAAAFAASEGWPADLSVAEIARRISGLPKASGHCARTVVITQGADPTVVATAGAVTTHPVIPLAKTQLVDTNGAGDAFVGGLLSQLVVGKDWTEACRAGNYAAHTIIQRSGCTFPDTPAFTWA